MLKILKLTHTHTHTHTHTPFLLGEINKFSKVAGYKITHTHTHTHTKSHAQKNMFNFLGLP